MTEQHKGPQSEESIVTRVPDIKFYGFGHEDLPYRIGFDIDNYGRLLQDSLHISPEDVSKISIRFLGLVPNEEFGAAREEIEGLAEEERRPIRLVSLHNELLEFASRTGFTLADTDQESATVIIKSILVTKLVFESFSIKHELVHKKLSKKPSAQIAGVLNRPLVYFYGLGLGEYLLQNINWLPRTLILINSFLFAKLGGIKIQDRLVNNHASLDERLQKEMEELIDPSKGGEVDLERIRQWADLISVYPTKPNGAKQ